MFRLDFRCPRLLAAGSLRPRHPGAAAPYDSAKAGVLHVITGLGTGGAELMLERLVTAQAADPALRPRVISLKDLGTVGPRLRASGIPVEALGMASIWQMPVAFFRLVRRIRATKPHIVQTWMYHADLLGGLAARIAGVRHIVWGVRVADISIKIGVSAATLHIRRICGALSSRLPERIVYVGESARAVHEAMGYDPRKSLIIHNGYVLREGDRIAPALARLRAEIGVPADSILVGSAGRYSPQKDYRTLVSAAERLAPNHPAVRFVLMGRDVSWDNPELAGWIRNAGLRDRFYLLGERADVHACMSALDVFCLHSLCEGFPNVVAEAMAAGVPCVVTDAGEAALIVGDTGAVVPPERPDLLADALSEVIAAGAEQRAERGRRAHRRVVENFSIETIAERYKDLYVTLDPAVGNASERGSALA